MPSANRLIDDFDAILFDLDGTLVDTMPLHHEAYAQVLRAHGLHLSWPDYMALVGPPASEVIGNFVTAAGGNPGSFDLARLHSDKKAAFADILATRRPERLPAARILDAAKGKTRCALVSSGNRHGVTAIVRILEWSDRFEVIVTGDDVTNGKPDPEPYRLAASMLGIAPDRCVVLEDTPAGMASARNAGMAAFDVADLTIAA
jgi:HAD superfamily hydrolase (TIGR01509 family)